jgi:hypothetical protein
MTGKIVSVLLLSLAVVSAAAAADQGPAVTGMVRLRVESWKWFDTPGFDDQYAFVGMLVRAGLTGKFTPTLEYQAEGAVPLVAGLPEDAVAPPPQGQLGLGGTYYAANDNETTAISGVLKQAWLRQSFGSSGNVRFGRFEFVDGLEFVPKEPLLAEVKRTRVAHRLIGNFGFTHAQRSMDGVDFNWNLGPTVRVSAVAFRPTEGAFQMNANRELDINVLYAGATRSTAAMDARLFFIGYQDRRDDVIKTDNRPLPVRRADTADLEIFTFGGHYLRLIPVEKGTIDVVLWGALQQGDWGSLSHDAWAGDIELGFRRGAWSYRAGAFVSTGDDDAGDGNHGTFFQILPTARQYARFPFYNAMNSRDIFGMATWRMSPAVTLSAEAHVLSASEENDLWYSGGGAFEEESFGFAGRPANGNSDLAHVIDASIDYALTPKTTLTGYIGLARGEAIVENIFAGDEAAYVYLELTRRF